MSQAGKGFEPNDYRSAEDMERAAFEYFSSFRVRSEGVTGFCRGNSDVYFEHDTVEVAARAGERSLPDPSTRFSEVKELIQERRKAERKAARPRRLAQSSGIPDCPKCRPEANPLTA